MRRLAQIENQVNFASGKEWQVSISVAPTLKLRLKCVRVHCLRNGALAEKKLILGSGQCASSISANQITSSIRFDWH